MAEPPTRLADSSPESSPSKKPVKRAAWYRMTDASSVGIEMAVAVTLCTVAGHYAERYLTHWSPWTTLLGVLVGVMAAARAVIRTAKTYQRSLQQDAPDETNPDAGDQP